MKHFDDPVLQAMASRRSVSQVGPSTPTDKELAGLLAAVTPVADHKALRPWRLILLRGDDRRVLGEALDAAAGVEREPGEVNDKPFRAELLIAVVARHVAHPKVPAWEQHATAAGAAHLLELALWQAGWGVMWRSGLYTDAPRRVRGPRARRPRAAAGLALRGGCGPSLPGPSRGLEEARPGPGPVPGPHAAGLSGRLRSAGPASRRRPSGGSAVPARRRRSPRRPPRGRR